MKIFDLIALSLQGLTADAVAAQNRRARDRVLVAEHSHGNLRLQFGEFFVKADVDAKYLRYRKEGFWQEA